MDKLQVLAGVSDEWLDILDNPELDDILDVLPKNITPPADKIFEFARLTDLNKIKVVILGQDPYPKDGDAHGLAFSSLTHLPVSLKNIYKCLLKHKLIDKIPTTGNLSYWAEQGVLLLNCALTTLVGKSNAHSKLWRPYTQKLLQNIAEIAKTKTIIFILWGNQSKEMKAHLNNKCHILEWSHPSPLTGSTFLDCTNFIDANKILTQNGAIPIDWNIEKSINEVDVQFRMHSTKQVVFVDGSANPNKNVPEAIGGYASSFVLGSFKYIILYGNIPNRPNYATNQRAEGYAIWKTLQYLDTRLDEWDECTIVSDSEFWINMIISYMPKWSRDGKDFKTMKNSDITIPLYKLYTKLTELHNKTIELLHIKSHNRDGWGNDKTDVYKYFCYLSNKYVDELAKYARINMQPGEDIIGEIEYE